MVVINITSDSDECELYIVGTEDNVETFCIKLQPCPLEFSLQRIGKSRICDKVLNSYISISSPVCYGKKNWPYCDTVD